jgi:Rrf2 family transcriptional regulator, iron-sulfur cluster assembly transcription factor
VSMSAKEKPRIQAEEIARELNVPKYFLSKIMKTLVQQGILHSTKGPYGGFSVNQKTLRTSLYEIIAVTKGDAQFDKCVLRLNKCNARHPCPLHVHMQHYKKDLHELFTRTTIGDLLNPDQPDFIQSLATI